MNYLHILESKGYYEKPVPFRDSNITFVNDYGETIKPPKTVRCDHPKHTFLRKDRKFRYNIEEMYVQKWKCEVEDVLNAPISSLIPAPPMIICKHCYEHEIKKYEKNIE
jgi:hypothetical protein